MGSGIWMTWGNRSPVLDFDLLGFNWGFFLKLGTLWTLLRLFTLLALRRLSLWYVILLLSWERLDADIVLRPNFLMVFIWMKSWSTKIHKNTRNMANTWNNPVKEWVNDLHQLFPTRLTKSWPPTFALKSDFQIRQISFSSFDFCWYQF